MIVDKTVRFGKPVLRGTRVPVEVVVCELAGRMAVEEVAAEYELEPAAVLAALPYATRMLETEEIRAVA